MLPENVNVNKPVAAHWYFAQWLVGSLRKPRLKLMWRGVVGRFLFFISSSQEVLLLKTALIYREKLWLWMCESQRHLFKWKQRCRIIAGPWLGVPNTTPNKHNPVIQTCVFILFLLKADALLIFWISTPASTTSHSVSSESLNSNCSQSLIINTFFLSWTSTPFAVDFFLMSCWWRIVSQAFFN